MAIQGLWAVPWLIEVDGYDARGRRRHLLRDERASILLGYLRARLLRHRALAHRGIHARHLFALRLRDQRRRDSR